MTTLKRKARVITTDGDSHHITVDCRSEEGITIGLLDTIMTCCAVLKGRDLSHAQVAEALKDLRSDEALRALMFKGVMGFNYEKISRAYEMDALERAMIPWKS
jgi:hypothetical protein